MPRCTYASINCNWVTLWHNWHKVKCRGTSIFFITTISVFPYCTQWWRRYFFSLSSVIRGPHKDLSDFLYSSNTTENQLILFYFQLYALEQRIWIVLKFFFLKIFVFFGHTYLCVFSNLGQLLEINYFLTQYYNGKENKYLDFRYTTHITRTSRVWQAIWGADIFVQKKSKMASGSLFFTKSAILPIFWPNITTGREKRDLDFSYTNYITRTSQVWQAIWVSYLFGTKSRKWPQDHYFSQKVLFYPFLTQYYNGKREKDLEFSYTTHIKRTSRVWQSIWGADIFSTRKSENGLRIIIFHKKCYFTHFWPNITTRREKKSGLQLYHPYHKKLTSVAIYLGSRSF